MPAVASGLGSMENITPELRTLSILPNVIPLEDRDHKLRGPVDYIGERAINGFHQKSTGGRSYRLRTITRLHLLRQWEHVDNLVNACAYKSHSTS